MQSLGSVANDQSDHDSRSRFKRWQIHAGGWDLSCLGQTRVFRRTFQAAKHVKQRGCDG